MGICRTRWVDDAIVKRSAEPINIGWPAKAKLSCVLNGSNSFILGRDADARSWHFRSTADANLSGVYTRNDNTLTRCPPPAAWSWTDAHRGSVPLGG
jgi:hypothetical protein